MGGGDHVRAGCRHGRLWGPEGHPGQAGEHQELGQEDLPVSDAKSVWLLLLKSNRDKLMNPSLRVTAILKLCLAGGKSQQTISLTETVFTLMEKLLVEASASHNQSLKQYQAFVGAASPADIDTSVLQGKILSSSEKNFPSDNLPIFFREVVRGWHCRRSSWRRRMPRRIN